MEFLQSRAALLLAAFAAGALLTALLLPGFEPNAKVERYQTRIKELEESIARREKLEEQLARREREMAKEMEAAAAATAALENSAGRLSKKTALAEKRLAMTKKRGKGNEPVFTESLNDRDLVIRLDRLLAGMGVGTGEAG
jgi:outer membrane murein-binding lipoprotein Lpp